MSKRTAAREIIFLGFVCRLTNAYTRVVMIIADLEDESSAPIIQINKANLFSLNIMDVQIK
jgi:hypothetical protein